MGRGNGATDRQRTIVTTSRLAPVPGAAPAVFPALDPAITPESGPRQRPVARYWSAGEGAEDAETGGLGAAPATLVPAEHTLERGTGRRAILLDAAAYPPGTTGVHVVLTFAASPHVLVGATCSRTDDTDITVIPRSYPREPVRWAGTIDLTRGQRRLAIGAPEWTVDITPIGTAAVEDGAVPRTVDGAGPYVSVPFLLDAGPFHATFMQRDGGTFAATLLTQRGDVAVLLAEEDGAFRVHQTVGVPHTGVYRLCVVADGTWSGGISADPADLPDAFLPDPESEPDPAPAPRRWWQGGARRH